MFAKARKYAETEIKLIRETSLNPTIVTIFTYFGFHLNLTRSIIPHVLSCAPPISLRIAASVYAFYFI